MTNCWCNYKIIALEDQELYMIYQTWIFGKAIRPLFTDWVTIIKLGDTQIDIINNSNKAVGDRKNHHL